jgi:hypothetical protein
MAISAESSGGGLAHPRAAEELRRSDLPASYLAASAASGAAQRKHKYLARIEVALLLATAAVSAAGGWIPLLDVDSERIVAAIFLVVALTLKVAARQRAYDRIWFDGRAVAETIKSVAWRYAMRVPPYDDDEAAADAALLHDIDAALEARPELVPHLGRLPAGGRQVSAAMRAVRRRGLDGRRAVYLDERVGPQIDWYGGKSEANGLAAARWFWIGLAFEAAALALAVVQTERTGMPDLVGLLAAVAIAATAWTQLDRHDELNKSYALAAHELSRLRLPVETARDEAAFAQAVDGVEAAVSREHTMWMARRS